MRTRTRSTDEQDATIAWRTKPKRVKTTGRRRSKAKKCVSQKRKNQRRCEHRARTRRMALKK